MQIFFKQTMSHGFDGSKKIFVERKKLRHNEPFPFPLTLFFLPRVIKKNNNDFYLMFIFAIYVYGAAHNLTCCVNLTRSLSFIGLVWFGAQKKKLIITSHSLYH